VEFQSVSGRILSGVSGSIAPGEIVGVTGLLGSGKSELGRLLAGVSVPRAGRILIEGRPVTLASPRQGVRAGIGYVPPDRRRMGGIMTLSAIENVTLPDLRSFRRFRHVPWLDKPAEAKATLDWMKLAGVVPQQPSQLFAEFSGGNQQKLVYGRWIRLSPRIFVLDEPTQGVDVGAIKDLYEIIRRHAASGAAVLLISSEWEDLPRICDRVIVLDRGSPVAELAGSELTEDSLTAAAFGHFADHSSEATSQGSEA
jgi:ribose transport system ATP-binding protein